MTFDEQSVRVSPWHVVRQADIDAFAAVSGDWHWLHTDPIEAADGPYAGTIAQGMLTMSLVPVLCSQAMDFTQWPERVNYGFGRVRFPAPVRPGDRIRVRIRGVESTGRGAGTLVSLDLVVEIEGRTKPACACEWLLHVSGSGPVLWSDASA